LKRVLLFGGSFDPIHHGHLIVARAAAEAIDADRVVLIPSAAPPHKQNASLAPAAVRVELCRAAVAGDPLFDVNDWETRQTGPNYTLLTVRHFRDVLPRRSEICWLVGMDSLVELHTWYHARELADACTLVTVGRPGVEPPDRQTLESFLTREQADRVLAHIVQSPLIEISATDIRARVAGGRSIRYLVPDAVAAVIKNRNLYRTL